MQFTTPLSFLLVSGFFTDIGSIEVEVVITPGNLRLGANGHIREIGLLVHDLAEHQIAQIDVKIFEDELQTKLLTNFSLRSKVVESLGNSVRALTGLTVKPLNFSREERISECFAFFTVVFLRASGVSKEIARSCLGVHTNWMEKQLDRIGDIPFVNVSFPGTHDSGSYRTSARVTTLVDYYIYSQEEDIFNQLMYGSRFFDLRIGFIHSNGKAVSDGFRIVHGIFITETEVKTVFDDVKDFLRLYPNEIILLDMHRFAVGSWNREVFDLFAGFIEEELGSLIIRDDPSRRTLNEILATGRRVLITWNEASPQRYFRGVVNIWANSDEIQPTYEYLKENLPLKSQSGWLYSAMAELTPQGFWNVVFDTYGGGLRGLADKHNFETMLWFRNDPIVRSSSTIIAVDFFMSTGVADLCSKINLERAGSPSAE